jgi:hypothetical protein
MGFWTGLLTFFSETSGAMTEMREENRGRPSRRRVQAEAAKSGGSRRWYWGDHWVMANTKSEARARFKRYFDEPIPKGVKIVIYEET